MRIIIKKIENGTGVKVSVKQKIKMLLTILKDRIVRF